MNSLTSATYFEIFLGLLLSVLSSAAIGYERQNRNKQAGIKTHILVGIGASTAVIVSKYGFIDSSHFDASRVASQVISGIGFLCAGLIFIKSDTIIEGLTTAAGLWATTAISMAFGAGLFLVGVVATFTLILVQWLNNQGTFQVGPARGRRVRVLAESHQEEALAILEEKLLNIGSIITFREESHDFEHSKYQIDLLLLIPAEISYRKTISIIRSVDRLCRYEVQSYFYDQLENHEQEDQED